MNAALLSVAPKIGGMVALARLAFAGSGPDWDLTWQTLLVLSIVTMTIGNVCALWQNHVRRLLAFSSIAHAGYMLIGLAAAQGGGAVEGAAATMFYLTVYCIATIGAFAVLIALGSPARQTNDLQELSGLYQRRPVLAAAMAACVFSLAGIPPLAGFCGKLALFMSSIDLSLSAAGLQVRSWFGVLSVAAAINAAIAAAYYLRIIAVMYFGEPPRTASPQSEPESESLRSLAPAAAACLCGFLVVVAGVLPGPLFRQAESAGAALHEARLARPSPVDSVAWREGPAKPPAGPAD
jgi:NADH-quinone oxidoreductase subunit N